MIRKGYIFPATSLQIYDTSGNARNTQRCLRVVFEADDQLLGPIIPKQALQLIDEACQQGITYISFIFGFHGDVLLYALPTNHIYSSANLTCPPPMARQHRRQFPPEVRLPMLSCQGKSGKASCVFRTFFLHGRKCLRARDGQGSGMLPRRLAYICLAFTKYNP
jgi:hypothetical protein